MPQQVVEVGSRGLARSIVPGERILLVRRARTVSTFSLQIARATEPVAATQEDQISNPTLSSLTGERTLPLQCLNCDPLIVDLAIRVMRLNREGTF